MRINKIIALTLCLIMLISAMPLSALAANALKSPAYFSEPYPNVGANTPIRPVHQYLYRQNPPVFLWPMIEDADSYDIKVCTNEEMTEVLYEIKGITNNYYHFKEPFETGKYYWWAYRYNRGKQSSDWCVARRFKVAEDSTEIILPTTKEILEKTGGQSPTLYLSPKTIPELKDKVQNNPYVKKYFEEVLVPLVDSYLANGVLAKPSLDLTNVPQANLQSTKQAAYAAYWGLFNYARMSSIVYHMTGNTKYADFAVDCLMEASTWDWESENSALAFPQYDTFFMRSYRFYGLAYDWIRSYMTEEERKQVSSDIFDRVMHKWDFVSGVIKKSPYASHEWTGLQSFGCSLMSILNDVPEAAPVFDDFVEVLMSTYLPFSIEDGGYSMGMNYWAASTDLDYPFMQAMTYAGIYDFYELPYNKNCYLWCLYMYPTPGAHFGSWGDSGDFNYPKDWLVQGAQHFGLLADRPELLWWKQKMGTSWEYGSVEAFFYIESDLMGRVPVEYPRDWHFKDQGMTAMHSDLIHEPRVSATFRSGMFGNYNHTHADINSFMIESNGKPLAWRNGYYGAWNSPHHLHFSRASHAHNTITYDNGIGQPNKAYDFDADGVTTMYISNTDMAAAVGDGKEAYVGGLGKYDRTFIYMRPDSFIVIDNLAASEKNIKNNGGSTFEWWINSIGTIDAHEDKRGVAITYEDQALDARIHYPKNITPFYSNLFSGTDLQDYKPIASLANWTYQGRIWFQTEKVKETKMVTTLNVHGSDEPSEYVKAKEYDNYMELEFGDGTMAYVSLATDETTMIDTGEFKFNGTAVVQNLDHLMFIGGTELYIGGEKVIEASRPVAVTIGSDELGVSSGDDYDVTIYFNDSYLPKADSIRFRNDEAPVGMGMGMEANVDKEAGALKIHADKGHYSLMLNDKPLPGGKAEGHFNYTISVDGVETACTTGELYYDSDYKVVANAYPEESVLKDGGEYIVTEVEGKVIANSKILEENVKFTHKAKDGIFLTENNAKIKLREIKNIDLEVSNSKDCDAMEKTATVLVQMENFKSKNGYVEITSLTPSGNLANMNDARVAVYYDVTIPEAGYYDFIMKYASGTTVSPTRYFELDGNKYFFYCAYTAGYGKNLTDWQVVRGNCNLYFEPGTYTIRFGSNGEGNLNIDWFGFIKDE